MDKLKLHSEGKNEYLEQLKKQFEEKVRSISNNKELSELEKEEMLKKIELKYKKLRIDSDYGLF